MSAEHQHHKSKKKRYTIVMMPDEEAGKAKNFRLTFWQLFGGIAVFLFSSIILIVLALTYTPLGEIFPLSNRGLENKYNKELISLNQRMSNLMEQLVELRSYNVKLRRAFGEDVTLTDSGTINIAARVPQPERNESVQQEQAATRSYQMMNPIRQVMPARNAGLGSIDRSVVSFPAVFPTEGYMTRGFEPEKNHFGIDIAGKKGKLIVAAAEGNVVFSGWTYNDGYVIIISHSSGFLSFYKHNQSLLKTAGSFVRRGDPIATLGDSGTTSSGPHLHFEIWKNGTPVDPSVYLINYFI